jgi:S-adenosylmethionine-diacylglycerol 3-amino-3-carboxypropyl transferase
MLIINKMNNSIAQIRKTWFEIRIFISLSIVIIISILSFLLFKNDPSTIEIAGRSLGFTSQLSIRYGYFVVAFLVIIASLIRMWAGSILTSRTVMTFKIQNNKLAISGPYNLVRNPIYFADLIAFTGLSLCLRPVGLLIPVLIYVHYVQLITYEEERLISKFGSTYAGYIRTVPSLFPGLKQFEQLFKVPLNFNLTFDGFRHNAQYILFIPGLIIASSTGKFIHAVLIGLPAVIDWAVIHTIIGVSKEPGPKGNTLPFNTKLIRSKVFRDILYSQCWEDPEMDRLAFDIRPGDTLFTITSGGCNALAFLIDDPESVICLDMNRFQNYLLSMKIGAFKTLTYYETLEFLGIRPSGNRWKMYKKIRSELTVAEQLYWDNKKTDIDHGIIHCGKYERYMHLLKRVFRILIGKKIISELFNSSCLEDQQILFNTKWNNFRWRLFCRIFLSRILASIFFDKAFYKYLEPSFSFDKYYRKAVKRAITQFPAKENYFLAYILLGNYLDNNLPPYLKKENYEIIKARVNRIKTVTCSCQEYFRSQPVEMISKFNFTNIFEWMSTEEFTLFLLETLRIAKNGAVITYRNHLVTRSRPEIFKDQIIPDIKLSDQLLKKDRSFIYKAYVVERIKKNICHL